MTNGGREQADDLLITEFGHHLDARRGLSEQTVRAYLSDMRQVKVFAQKEHLESLLEADLAFLRAWLADWAEQGKARSTLVRKGASVRTFYAWVRRTNKIESDPAERLVTPQPHNKLPRVLSESAVAQMLNFAGEASTGRGPS